MDTMHCDHAHHSISSLQLPLGPQYDLHLSSSPVCLSILPCPVPAAHMCESMGPSAGTQTAYPCKQSQRKKT